MVIHIRIKYILVFVTNYSGTFVLTCERLKALSWDSFEIFYIIMQVLREAVTAKGPEIDTFVNNYRDLTQHKPSLVDPVVRAVRDDWDELLGQIENLLEEREQALLESRELQDAQNTMDHDLEDFVKELEKIEAAEASLTDKVNQLKVSFFAT